MYWSHITRSMSKYSLEETQKRGGALGHVVGLGPHRVTREDFPGYETDARIGGVWVNMRRAGESSRERTESVKTAKGQGQLQARKARSPRTGQGQKGAPGSGGWKTLTTADNTHVLSRTREGDRHGRRRWIYGNHNC